MAAGLAGAAPPTPDQSPAVWDRWNAKSPLDQARDAVTADGTFIERLQAVPSDDRARWRLEMFGAVRTLQDVMLMRLVERAMHTWDIEVALNPAAVLTDDVSRLEIDTLLPAVIGRVGRPVPEPIMVRVATTRPERELMLELTPEGAGELVACLQ